MNCLAVLLCGHCWLHGFHCYCVVCHFVQTVSCTVVCCVTDIIHIFTFWVHCLYSTVYRPIWCRMNSLERWTPGSQALWFHRHPFVDNKWQIRHCWQSALSNSQLLWTSLCNRWLAVRQAVTPYLNTVRIREPETQQYIYGLNFTLQYPTAVQAWQTCPLWEPSPSHLLLL